MLYVDEISLSQYISASIFSRRVSCGADADKGASEIMSAATIQSFSQYKACDSSSGNDDGFLENCCMLYGHVHAGKVGAQSLEMTGSSDALQKNDMEACL